MQFMKDKSIQNRDPTGRLFGTDVVVVDLNGRVRAGSRETDHVVLIVIDIDAQFTDGVVFRAHVVDHEHISVDLEIKENE
ncbi:hypothetical protein AVEN_61282-1, partial [Araneus ventricosus]